MNSKIEKSNNSAFIILMLNPIRERDPKIDIEVCVPNE